MNGTTPRLREKNEGPRVSGFLVMVCGLALLTIDPSLARAQKPRPFHPLPELTRDEVGPPNHVLTPRDKRRFAEREILPVGDVLCVVLPVQQSTAYRWRPVKFDEKVLRWLKPDLGKPPLRAMSKEFEFLADGPLGRPDALQVFRFEVIAPGRKVPVRFQLFSAIDGTPSDLFFDAHINTAERRR